MSNYNGRIEEGVKRKMEEERFVIQKLELRKDIVWIDVKGAMNAEEAMISLDNFVQNNPEYVYRIIKVFVSIYRIGKQ